MPWLVVQEDDRFCVYKKGANGEAEGKSLKCYGDESEAKDYVKALYANAKESEKEYSLSSLITAKFDKLLQSLGVKEKDVSELSGFTFTELSGDIQPLTNSYIDGMAAGTFTCMTGEEVTFKPRELEAYVRNTKRVIESTRTEKGEIVGLPIDENGHDHKGGAGWIVGLQHDRSRNVIRFLVNWTDHGTSLIKSNMRRFFSPSVDTQGTYIRGGSLTNWPATRLSTGQILLRPVELSESIKEIDMDKTVLEAINELRETLVEALGKNSRPELEEGRTEPSSESHVSPALQELLGSQEGIDELGERAMEIAQDVIKAEKRKIHAVEFAAKIVGGTPEKPFGLAIKPNDLVALLLSLPDPQARAVEKILERTLEVAVDFSEHGVDSLGYVRKPKLPKEFKAAMEQWIAAGKTTREFFKVNPEIGDYDQFDLAEFATTKED